MKCHHTGKLLSELSAYSQALALADLTGVSLVAGQATAFAVSIDHPAYCLVIKVCA
jgi:hypothetical protein